MISLNLAVFGLQKVWYSSVAFVLNFNVAIAYLHSLSRYVSSGCLQLKEITFRGVRIDTIIEILTGD